MFFSQAFETKNAANKTSLTRILILGCAAVCEAVACSVVDVVKVSRMDW